MRTDGLEEFSLRPLSHGPLFGVFLAACGIDGALDVLHAGVGCKGKTQRLLVDHDWGREAHAQVGWTELGEEDWIRDPVEPLVRNGIELVRRRRPRLLLVSASLPVELTGADIDAAVARLREAVPCPVVHIPTLPNAADFWTGYSAVIRGLLNLVDWAQAPAGRRTVSLIGNLFHRHELDQAANLAEWKRLVALVGGTMGPVWFSGTDLSDLLSVHRSQLLVRLPYAGLDAGELASLSGRAVLDSPLPLGVQATGSWLRAVGRLLALESSAIDRIVVEEERKTKPRLDMARRALAGRKLAIMADTPAAAAWCGLAIELGMQPRQVFLLDWSLGGDAGFSRLLELAGHTLPAGLDLCTAPSLRRLRSWLDDPSESPDLVIRPDLGLAGSRWEALPTLESGFPSPHQHVVYPLPEIGYAGAVAQAQKLLDSWARAR